jgi:hypothetical protein
MALTRHDKPTTESRPRDKTLSKGGRAARGRPRASGTSPARNAAASCPGVRVLRPGQREAIGLYSTVVTSRAPAPASSICSTAAGARSRFARAQPRLA